MRDPLRVIVFDWDGTLMDSAGRITASMQAAASQTGLPVPSEHAVKDVIGLGLEEAIAQLLGTVAPAVKQRFVAAYRDQFLEKCSVPTPLFPGVHELLNDLAAAGYTLAVATGKSRQGLDRVLAETGVGAFFAATRCADETRSKPHPQMLWEIMNELKVGAGETLMVGDSVWDMAMAESAGTPSLGVTYGVHDRERLLQHNPLALVTEVAQIGTWLGEYRFQ